jgi:hypothetical protein
VQGAAEENGSPGNKAPAATLIERAAGPLLPRRDFAAAADEARRTYDAGFVAIEMNFRRRISATGDRSTNSRP